jgi:tetratricopeptide (TPR) repeat protein
LEKYFQQLAAKSNDPTAKSLLLFSLGGFISEKDKARSLEQMNSAFKPTVVYMPKDMEIYGLALLDAGKAEQAVLVFQKISTDYPNPQGVDPQAAPQLIQEAQAAAIFGMGRVAQVSKKTPEAAQFFNQLKSLYPWSPKMLEANYGMAEALIAENKADEAMKILGAIIRAQNATADLRASSFLLYGYIMKDKATTETDPEKKKQALATAIDFFMKIPQFYSGVPAAALTGLWEGAQLLEQQAAVSSDSKFKAQQLKRAKAAYNQIKESFPNDKLAPQAEERFKSLPDA